jgi:hypothetical protein
MRAAIIDQLPDYPTVARAGQVSGRLAAQYDWAEASVRSQLAKMAEEGEIARPARGMYSRLPVARPESTEAPAATGASVSEESSDDSSRKEGGTGYEPAPPVVRDHDPDNPERDLDHGYGASLVEAL